MALIILPDVPHRDAALAHLHEVVGPVLHRHPSGAPWILGDSGNRTFVVARNRAIDVAVVGRCVPSDKELGGAIKNIGSVTDLDTLAADIVEFDAILLAREHGRLRAQAPAFLARSLFWTEFDGSSAISDEQLPLARLNGLEFDEAVLVSRLTNAELSYPFSVHSIWRGVQGLRPGEYLDVSGISAPRRRTWWTPPTPTRRLAELAPELTAGIQAAIAARTRQRTTVSTDLSGGLDSTTLSFHVSETGLKHHTFFMRSQNTANTDWQWAERAAREIGSPHITVPYQSVLSSLDDDDAVTFSRLPEGPSLSATASAATPSIADAIASTGSTIHLNGHAGDALFGPVSTMLWSLVHSSAPQRFRRAWRHRTLNRIPLGAMIRMLGHQRSYRQDLERLAQGNLARPKHDAEEYSRWIATPRVHPAVRPDARAQIADLARRELEGGAGEFASDRTVHQIVQYLAVHGAAVRRMNHTVDTTSDLYFDSPYLDRRIVEPALSLNISERTYQYPVKPLLAAARPGPMSIDYFLRRDKGEYSAETFDQHRRHLDRLRRLFREGSVLEQMGIVSADVVVRSLDAYSVDGLAYADIAYLGFAERWLRSVRDDRLHGTAQQKAAR
ncbi:asparagine synthase-related protein [Nonomuraea sp. NPDC049714]|uniref:asparagine synthase-related protein n=1 Tax=Nonomuraea sp. NPDC049714 TaxID=3364357 RepID=UPI0037B1468E